MKEDFDIVFEEKDKEISEIKCGAYAANIDL